MCLLCDNKYYNDDIVYFLKLYTNGEILLLLTREHFWLSQVDRWVLLHLLGKARDDAKVPKMHRTAPIIKNYPI